MASPLPGGLPDEDYEYAPGDVYVRVSDAGKSTPGFDNSVSGNVPGSDVWVLPAVQNLAMPFLGFGTEELPDGFGAITYSLQAMNGPGNFALWSVDGFGTPTVEMSTLLGDTSMTLASGTHSHFNFGFTQAGIYELLLTATSVLTPSMTDTQSFFFAVGSSTPGVQGFPSHPAFCWPAWRRPDSESVAGEADELRQRLQVNPASLESVTPGRDPGNEERQLSDICVASGKKTIHLAARWRGILPPAKLDSPGLVTPVGAVRSESRWRR